MIEMRLTEERWRAEWAKDAADTQASGRATLDHRGQTVCSKRIARSTARSRPRSNSKPPGLARREQRLIAGRVCFELFVFVAVLLLVIRQHRALRDAIVTPVAALLQHIRRIRDGQLEAAVDRNAPRELAELAQGLNEVVRALVSARRIGVLPRRSTQ